MNTLSFTDALARNVLEYSPDAMIIVSPEGAIQYFNRNAEIIFGYERDVVMGQHINLLVPGRFHAMHSEQMFDYLSAHTKRTIGPGRELFAVRHDGSEFRVEVVLGPLGDREKFSVLAIIRDISERVATQENARVAAEELLFRANMVDAVGQAVIAADPQKIILYWNNTADRMFGWTREEALGKNFQSLIPSHLSHEDWRTIDSNIAAGHTWHGERVLARNDGSSYPALITISPNYNTDSTPNGFIWTSYDNSKHRLAQEALVESERMQRLILENVDDVITSLRVDSFASLMQGTDVSIQFMSPSVERQLGYSTEQFKADTALWPSLLHPDDRESFAAANAKLFETRLSMTHSFRIRTKTGEYRWLEDRVTPQLDDAGRVHGLFIVSRDVTEQQKAEDQIRKSLHEKEVLLKEIHHRVKNNMQIVSSMLNLQSGKIIDPQDRAMFLDSQNRVRSIALVHELLYQSHDLSLIDFSEYVRKLSEITLSMYSAKERNISMVIDSPPVFFEISFAIPLGLIINELLNNAFKYAFPADRGGQLSLTIEPLPESGFRICFADNGVGLSDDVDLNNAETLGLQLVTIMCEQLNAALTVQRKNGTRFEITLPMKG